jgi:hypothetical protein
MIDDGEVVPTAPAPLVDKTRLVAPKTAASLRSVRGASLPADDRHLAGVAHPGRRHRRADARADGRRRGDGAAGRDGAASVVVFRPSLVGASYGTLNAAPTGSSDGILTVPDPRTVSRATGLTLTASDNVLTARVLVGGPRMSHGTVLARVDVTTGGIALIARQVGPGRMIVGHVRPGEPARIDRVDGRDVTTICSGSAPTTLVGVQSASLTIDGENASITLNNVTLAPAGDGACSLHGDPNLSDRGAWGIAPSQTGAQLDVMAITLTR